MMLLCVVPEVSESKTFLRGSSLLLVGRLIALMLNFGVQVLIVRTLTKSDFGAFAYALSVIAILTNLNLLGLSKAIGRSLAVHDEREEAGAIAGVLLGGLGIILGFGALIVCAVSFGQELLDAHVVGNPRSTEVLMWLIFLVPFQAIDNVFQNTAAVFVGARAIFFRKHILGPALKLFSISVVIAAEGDVLTLSTMYVIATAVGVALYVKILWQSLVQREVLSSVKSRDISWPGTGLLLLAGPLLATDLVVALESNLAVMLLESSHGTQSVASLRAIAPLVGLVFLISESFKFLYLPLATRLLERSDLSGLNDHYWRSFRWIVLLSLPIVVTLSLFADLIVPLMFGERYADSALLLSIMVPIQFGAASMALNHYTLTALNRGRFMMQANLFSLLFTLMLTVLLTPPFAEVGAAIAMSVSLLVHYGIQFLGLRESGIGTPRAENTRLFLQALCALCVLLALKFAFEVGPVLLLLLAVLLTATVFFLNLSRDELVSTFPEIVRLPLVKKLVGQRSA